MTVNAQNQEAATISTSGSIVSAQGQSQPNPSSDRLTGALVVTTSADYWGGYAGWFTEDRLNMYDQSDANIIKLMISGWAWKNNVWIPEQQTNYRNRINQLTKWFNDHGIKVILEVYVFSEDHANWEANWQNKADFIMGTSSRYFSHQEYYQMLRELAVIDAYAIGIFNEPPGYDKVSYSQQELWDNYYPLILNGIDEIRAINPNMVIHVESIPFWDLTPMINNPIPRSNIVYEWHHYLMDNSVPAITDAINQGDLSEGKRLFDSFLLEKKIP
jgi:hypothetical protein